MDETSKSEINSDSTLDLLQSIINIKHESKPVSLNTVQVSWMNNVPQNMNTQESFYQDVPVPPAFSPPQANDHFSSCSPQQNNEHYQFGYAQVQNMSPQCPPEYNYSQLQNYPEVMCSDDALQSCAIGSYSLGATLSPFESSPEITSSHIFVEPAMQPQNFSPPLNPPCNQFVDFNMVHASPNVSPPLCQTDANRTSPLQIGKSFFHWQIEQEEKKLANVPEEQLLTKDADGDT